MNGGYAKLWGSILTSTIWGEDHGTRIVWLAMLASANALGVVEGSVPGFAHVARVSREEMERALERLRAPDPHSRTKDFDGRRIEDVDGGWRILNHAKYREKSPPSRRALYMRGWRAKKAILDGLRRDTGQAPGPPCEFCHQYPCRCEEPADAS